jgi:O-antigen ligase
MFLYYFLIFVSPFYHHKIFDRGIGPITVVKITGALTTLYALYYVTSRRRVPHYLASRQAQLFLALVVVALISFASESSMRSYAFEPVFTYISMLALFFVTLSLVDTPSKIWWSLITSLASVSFAALYLVKEAVQYRDRPGFVVGDPNYFTDATLLVIPVAYYLITSRQQKPFYRWAALAMLSPVLLAIGLTSSRGGLIGMAVLMGYIVWNTTNRLRSAFVLLALLGPPLTMFPFGPMHRLLHPSGGDELGKAERLIAWKAGLSMIGNKPIQGIGLGLFKPLLGEYSGYPQFHRIAHNTYIEIAAELGIPALAIFLFLLWETYRSLERVRRAARAMQDPTLYMVATAIQGGVLAFTVGSFFISAEYIKLFWIYVFLSIVLARLAYDHLAKTEGSQSSS